MRGCFKGKKDVLDYDSTGPLYPQQVVSVDHLPSNDCTVCIVVKDFHQLRIYEFSFEVVG